jgi:hypothetical protein
MSWQKLSGEGLRLISIQTSSGRWGGAFLPGSDAYYLWVGQEWPAFEAKWRDLTNGNLRLVDLVIEESASGTPHYSGAWREGSDGHDTIPRAAPRGRGGNVRMAEMPIKTAEVVASSSSGSLESDDIPPARVSLSATCRKPEGEHPCLIM